MIFIFCNSEDFTPPLLSWQYRLTHPDDMGLVTTLMTHREQWSFIDLRIPNEVPVPTMAAVIHSINTAQQNIPSVRRWAQDWRCRLIRPLWLPPDERVPGTLVRIARTHLNLFLIHRVAHIDQYL